MNMEQAIKEVEAEDRREWAVAVSGIAVGRSPAPSGVRPNAVVTWPMCV